MSPAAVTDQVRNGLADTSVKQAKRKQMTELMKLDVQGWTKALVWVVLRRRTLFHIDEASEVRSGPNAFIMLAACAAFACFGVTFFFQAIGLKVTPGGRSDTLFEACIELLRRTVAALKSADDLHPDGWTVALLLPIGVVLCSSAVLAWLAKQYGRLRKAQSPRYRAWWLGMAGYLCVLGVVAPVVGMGRVLVERYVPRSRFVDWSVASFEVMLCLTLLLIGFQAWRRVKGQGYNNAIWEAFAFSPILIVLWMDLVTLPGWVQRHQPGVNARAISNCDVAARTCTVALTLSDASTLELLPDTAVTSELIYGARLEQRSVVTLRATWLSDPQLEGWPIQLHDDQPHYARLRFESPRAGDKCPPLKDLAAAAGLVVTASLRVDGLVLGSEGKSEFNSVIQEVEKPVPGAWARTVLGVCLAATAPPSVAASPASVATMRSK